MGVWPWWGPRVSGRAAICYPFRTSVAIGAQVATDPGETGHPVVMPSMGIEEARRRFTSARVATLATVGSSGEVDLVPVTFVVSGNQLVSVVDHKPKTTPHLRRLGNIMDNPRVTVLAHDYDEDWDRLWWVRVRGAARTTTSGPDHQDAIRLMTGKYRQLVDTPPTGPVIILEIDQWLGWTARQLES